MSESSGKKTKKQAINAWPPVEGASVNEVKMAKVEKLKKRTKELNEKSKQTKKSAFKMKKLNRPTWFQIGIPHSPPGDRVSKTFADHPRLVEHRKREAAAQIERKQLIHLDIDVTKSESKINLYRQRNELKQWKSKTNHW